MWLFNYTTIFPFPKPVILKRWNSTWQRKNHTNQRMTPGLSSGPASGHYNLAAGIVQQVGQAEIHQSPPKLTSIIAPTLQPTFLISIAWSRFSPTETCSFSGCVIAPTCSWQLLALCFFHDQRSHSRQSLHCSIYEYPQRPVNSWSTVWLRPLRVSIDIEEPALNNTQ
jgi:hypothetical protein